jgi:hypothetical protein
VFNFLYWQAKRTNNQKEGLNGRCTGCIKVLGPRVEEESPARTVQADTSFSEKSGGEETGASSESQRLSVKKDAAPAKARGRQNRRRKTAVGLDRPLTVGYLDLVDVPSL